MLLLQLLQQPVDLSGLSLEVGPDRPPVKTDVVSHDLFNAIAHLLAEGLGENGVLDS